MRRGALIDQSVFQSWKKPVESVSSD